MVTSASISTLSEWIEKEKDFETLSYAGNQCHHKVAECQYKKVGRANQGTAHS